MCHAVASTERLFFESVDAAAIRRRVSEIVFHSSLVAEMQAITAMRNVATQGEAATSVLDLRMHRIGPPRAAGVQKSNRKFRSSRSECLIAPGPPIHVASTCGERIRSATQSVPAMWSY